MDATTRSGHTNRLINAASPYLLQHAHNPVDWYEWGAEALQKARDEDKPIFLSIGYSACHWCHVMAHESFEDEATAALMNRLFVNIKVDREERPDLDEIYMQATVLMNQGQGGWPMSVWLTPELKPFFAGTYFPPEVRWGRPSFQDVCTRVAAAWTDNREGVAASAERLTRAVAHSLQSSGDEGTISLADVDRAALALAAAFDPERGGMISGGTNKFPPSMAIDLLLRAAARRGPEDAEGGRLRELVELTLDAMAHGGIYDQLGGGIARYSTDVRWHVPHFEKMLYDQALVSRAYVDAFQVTGKPLYKRIATEICDYVLADLQAPEGGFYSARDADSEGREGQYYVWTKAEVLAALGERDGELFCAYYDVSEAGNWSDPHEPDTVKNVLRIMRDIDTVARLNDVSADELAERLAAGRQKLLAVRGRRVPPARDEKILAEWNGLMISSLARVGAVLGESRFVEAACRAAEFVLAEQCAGGRLQRASRAGRVTAAAFLPDYAAMIEGLLELYEATFERRWLDHARALNRVVIDHYRDETSGGFYFAADDHERLIVRARDVRDGAVPSGNSMQLMNLLRLSVLLDEPELRVMADRSLEHFAADVIHAPAVAERFLAAAEFALVGPVEIRVAGDPDAADTRALLAEIRREYLPNRVLMLGGAASFDDRRPTRRSAATAEERSVRSPDAADVRRPRGDDATAVYVCRGGTCRPPAATVEELREALRA
ncbi:MAG: thioredoxin domain-containing protein [Phycisphaerae bacterium]|jgi:uncharacterized protein YyaL (SSP411 family)